MKKKNKKKKVYVLLLIIIYFTSFFITIKYNYDKESVFIERIIESTNKYKKKENKKFITKLVSFIASVDLGKPNTYINNNYTKVNNEYKSNISLVKLKSNTNPLIYIYNTHQSEEYTLSNKELYNIKPTVLTASYILKENLNKKGINTIVEENSIKEILNINNWDYASSYKASRILLEDIIKKEKTLKYFIDIHRDSVSKNISTINIDGISYAKVLFILGLENPNYKDNLEMIESINNMINSKYPNLSRGIYKKEGKGVNGVYNQDFNKNTILIEVGGEGNTIDEVYNTCLIISDVLEEYIRRDNEK